MKKILSPLLITLASSLSLTAFAQPGSNDPAFNVADTGFGYGDGANGVVNAIAIQTDGKTLIAGSFTTYHGTARNRLARLNTDGSLDGTFNVGTGADDYVSTILIQSDGKILVGGSFTTYNGIARNRIARLNADGSLDATFAVGTGANDNISAMAVQSNGKIVIGGSFTAFNGTARNRITRLNIDGSLDGTFSVGTGANNEVLAIALQADGKIIAGGYFTSYNGTARNRIARLNADGSLDGTFTVGTGADSFVRAVAIQSDGRIIISGFFTGYNGTSRNGIARLNTNGSLDGTFTVGTSADDFVGTVALQSDGKILIGGYFSTYNGIAQYRIVRLNTNGSLDTSFIVDAGVGMTGFIYEVRLQSDGKIIIGGMFDVYNGSGRNNITRLNANGSLDVLFGVGTGANGAIHAIAVQSDGKIIIGGDFTTYNGVEKKHIARLNTDGTLDASFTAEADSTVHTIAIQGDGRIVIGGNFIECNDTSRNRIARLNSNGSLDAAFDPEADAGYLYIHVYTAAIQSDGKIVIGGDILKNDAGGGYTMVRLNANGSADAAFNFGGGAYFSGTVRTVAIQKDGKIIAGGSFIFSNADQYHYSIARLNTDGSLDAAFHPGAGISLSGDISTVAIQGDGKIIMGGSFTTYGASRSYKNIARLNTSGNLDATFNTGTGPNNAVSAIALQNNDGKVIIGGYFTACNGTARNSLARLHADGSLDNTFNVGVGANGGLIAMAMQNDGKVVLGGYFTAYNGIGRNRLARVIALPCVNPTTPTLSATSASHCGPQSTTLDIESGTLNSASEWKWYNSSCGGTPAGSGTSITVSPTVTTTYYVRGEGGCVAPGACTSITVTVKPLPDVATALTGTTITANQTGATYKWLNCDQDNLPLAGATSQSYTPTQNGNYAVEITFNGCSGTSACVNVTITATEETVPSIERLAVYPNPSNGMFKVQSSGEGVYSVKNDLGQTVQLLNLHDANSYTANISHLKPGVYFIVGFNKNELTAKKIVVTE